MFDEALCQVGYRRYLSRYWAKIHWVEHRLPRSVLDPLKWGDLGKRARESLALDVSCLYFPLVREP